MENKTKESSVPMGFAMTLGQNLDAMRYFGSLSDAQQRQIISNARNVHSKEEMQSLIQSMAEHPLF